MIRLALGRIMLAFFTLVMVALVVFATTELLPGDVCTAFLGRDARNEDRLERCRQERGLYRPAVERFGEWAGGLLRGDLGKSVIRDRPIGDVIGSRLRNTFVLGISAAAVGIPLAIALGVFSAIKRDSLFDLSISSVALFAMTLPDFVTATVLVFIFSFALGWFPAVTLINVNAPITELLPNIVLPVIVLTLVMVAHIMRLVRTSTIEVLASDYAEMAQLKGVPFAQVVRRHVLPNAMLPAINVIALTLGWLLGGTTIIESIFNYPGIGTLLLNAISDRDLPLVQSLALLLAVIYIGLNLVADLLTLTLNPRLRTMRA
jgi:peptide/nickel transport system permease protein